MSYNLTPEAMTIIENRAGSSANHASWISQAIIEYDRMLTAKELADTVLLTQLEKDVTEIKRALTALLRLAQA